MPLTIDISQDKFLNEICDVFETRGEARGEARGKAEGKAEAVRDILESGRFSVEEVADLLKVSLDLVLSVKQKMLKAAKRKKVNKK